MSGSQTINVWFTLIHALLVVSETVKEDGADEVRERGTKSVDETAWCLGSITWIDMESKDMCV